MPIFYYKAIDRDHKMRIGSLDAATRKAAVMDLKNQQLRPLAIQDTPLDIPVGRSSWEWLKKSNGVSRSSALPFLKKLLQLHQGGLPIGDALKILSARLTELPLKKIANALWQDLSQGHTLAIGIKNHPEVFDPSLVYLIEAGEATGNLAPVLENIVDYLEQAAALKKKVIASLAYPIFISFIALGVVCIFLFFLLPRIESMLVSLGGQLSLSARLLIGFAHFLIQFGPFILLGLGIGLVLLMRYRRTPQGQYAIDGYLLKIPFVNQLLVNADLCRVTNLLSTLLGSGVNTTQALKLTEKSIHNKVLLSEFQAARHQITEGINFSHAFRRSQLFPAMGLDILSVGENTGNIIPSLKEIHRTQSQIMADQLQFLTGFISTAALAFAFSLVVILTLGIVSSILQVSQSIR